MPESPVIRLDSQAPLEFPWGAIKWLMNNDLDEDAEQTFGIVFIGPGQKNPRHFHPNCEELLHVLSGTCTHSLGDQSYPMSPGDLIRIPAGVVHHAENDGWEPLRAIISFSDGDRKTVFLDNDR
jgi:quercetin dioxygenase-like cupin family protein